MAQQHTHPVARRLRVQAWLRSVAHHSMMYGTPISEAARINRESFPRQTAVALLAQIVRAAAVWLVKTELRQAAADLNMQLDDATLSLLAEIVVDGLLAG